jgi:hypothetical protein
LEERVRWEENPPEQKKRFLGEVGKKNHTPLDPFLTGKFGAL